MNPPEETARAIVWILAGAIVPMIAAQIGGLIAATGAFCFVMALVVIIYLRTEVER